MSQPSCDACTELREYAPDFVLNGVTNKVATSLKNDMGIASKSNHDNCEDLNDVNDCLIGRLGQEIESLDVCDWKDFMSRMMPNLYETLKAMIMSDCGQWIRLEDLCRKLDDVMDSKVRGYGIYPYASRESIGTIGEKNGSPLITFKPDEGASAASTSIGIAYLQREYLECSGADSKLYEWIDVRLYRTIISGDAAKGDILWYASKQEIQDACGMSDRLWTAFTTTSWTWYDAPMDDGRFGILRLTVDENRMGANYMTIEFRGTTYPAGSVGTTQGIDHHHHDMTRRLYIYNV